MWIVVWEDLISLKIKTKSKVRMSDINQTVVINQRSKQIKKIRSCNWYVLLLSLFFSIILKRKLKLTLEKMHFYNKCKHQLKEKQMKKKNEIYI